MAFLSHPTFKKVGIRRPFFKSIALGRGFAKGQAIGKLSVWKHKFAWFKISTDIFHKLTSKLISFPGALISCLSVQNLNENPVLACINYIGTCMIAALLF